MWSWWTVNASTLPQSRDAKAQKSVQAPIFALDSVKVSVYAVHAPPNDRPKAKADNQLRQSKKAGESLRNIVRRLCPPLHSLPSCSANNQSSLLINYKIPLLNKSIFGIFLPIHYLYLMANKNVRLSRFLFHFLFHFLCNLLCHVDKTICIHYLPQ